MKGQKEETQRIFTIFLAILMVESWNDVILKNILIKGHYFITKPKWIPSVGYWESVLEMYFGPNNAFIRNYTIFSILYRQESVQLLHWEKDTVKFQLLWNYSAYVMLKNTINLQIVCATQALTIKWIHSTQSISLFSTLFREWHFKERGSILVFILLLHMITVCNLYRVFHPIPRLGLSDDTRHWPARFQITETKTETWRRPIQSEFR